MKRRVFLATSAAATATAVPALRARAADIPASSDYDLTTPTGTIFGTLQLPTAPGRVPVALIVAGSGPTDRNGNSPVLRLDTYAKLATLLAAQGIATVRYDKRGIAASHAAQPSENDIRFDAYVADAAAWIDRLRADGRFSRVTVAGHSEGSLIGMIAGQRSRLDAFVSLEGAGFPAPVLLETQLRARLASQPDLLAKALTTLKSLAAGTPVPETDIPQPLAGLFRPSVQPYLISWFRVDPRAEIAKLRGAITIVQGTHDIQVGEADARALHAAHPKSTLVSIDGMTHVLVDDPGTTFEQQISGAYADASRPIDATLARTLVAAASA